MEPCPPTNSIGTRFTKPFARSSGHVKSCVNCGAWLKILKRKILSSVRNGPMTKKELINLLQQDKSDPDIEVIFLADDSWGYDISGTMGVHKVNKGVSLDDEVAGNNCLVLY